MKYQVVKTSSLNLMSAYNRLKFAIVDEQGNIVALHKTKKDAEYYADLIERTDR